MTVLAYRRYRLTVRANACLQLPDYAGSMLRGAYGHALRAMAAPGHENGSRCSSEQACAYCSLFAAPPAATHRLQKFSQLPAPYIIEPPLTGARELQAGECFDFSLVLVGRALAHLPSCILAFVRACEAGLGKGGAACSLQRVVRVHDDVVVWQAGWRTLHTPLSEQPIRAPVFADRVRLHFCTPLRLQRQGRLVDAVTLDARTLLVAMARRYQLLCDAHGEGKVPKIEFKRFSDQARQVALPAVAMRWVDWQRYSNRQQRRMTLGGLLGSVTLAGDLAPFAELLHHGQWLHVGKNTPFGLGQYQLEIIR